MFWLLETVSLLEPYLSHVCCFTLSPSLSLFLFSVTTSTGQSDGAGSVVFSLRWAKTNVISSALVRNVVLSSIMFHMLCVEDILHLRRSA